RDEKQLLPCAAYLNGEYGQKDIYVGVPCIIGAGGVEKIVEIALPDEQKKQFEHSVAAVRELVASTKLDKKAA
ncbi:MAG: malate dehydrogenase, partial [Rickettsiales bacterium]